MLVPYRGETKLLVLILVCFRFIYLTFFKGEDKESWKQYDALELVQKYTGKDLHVLVHQGSADNFLQEQLSTKQFEDTLKVNPHLSSGSVIMADGYDHSYYFVSTFLEEHVRHHATHLKA